MITKKILVVDDEEDIRESVKQVLETMNYQVNLASSGREALELLQKNIFDLVLLDILMPQMSGTQTLEKIRTNPKTKDQKVAFLTVVDLKKYGKDAVDKFKLVDYFHKPIEINDFKKRIKKILK